MKLRPINDEDLKGLYSIIYSGPKPKWTDYNAPYFNEYVWMDYQEFLSSNQRAWLQGEDVLGIELENRIIGMVSRNWIDENTRWLEIGIVIYDDSYWNKGLGYQALKIWLQQTFETFPQVQRLGLTTWSGNQGMMKVAEKIGMKEEGRLRKVRYYKGIYYDSMKYGILREEFF